MALPYEVHQHSEGFKSNILFHALQLILMSCNTCLPQFTKHLLHFAAQYQLLEKSMLLLQDLY